MWIGRADCWKFGRDWGVKWEWFAGWNGFWFRWNGRGGRAEFFAEGKRENWVAFRCSGTLSLRGDKKAMKEEDAGGFKQLLGGVKRGGFQISTGGSTGADGEVAGKETGSKCPSGEPLREERRRMSY